MDVEGARKIKDAVRRHFAGGAKSGNKAYAVFQADGAEADLDTVLSALPTSGAPLAKARDVTQAGRRNHNVVIAIPQVVAFRKKWKDGSAVEYGEELLVQKVRYGNCTEMSCVAAYLVDQEDPDGDIPISIVTTDGPGDHVFCALGSVSDWKSVKEPPRSCRRTIVIDPWANICCLAPDYYTEFKGTMNKWLAAGKRISGGFNIWLAPDKDYRSKFKSSDLDIRNARTNPPFDRDLLDDSA